MIRRPQLIALLAATLLSPVTLPAAASAQEAGTAAAPPASPPKLIIAISVDQFSADLFAEYRASFTGGLARLARGVVFPSGYQSHAATETCPGHSTLLSGVHPGRSGIVANNYIDLAAPRNDKTVYCMEDESVPGSSSKNYTPSIKHLRVPVLGDRMKQADPAVQVVSVSGKDRAAILMGGRSADEVLWLDGKTGLTSYPGTALSPTAQAAGNAIMQAVAEPRPAMNLPTACAARDIAIPLAEGGSVGTGRFARAAGDARAFSASPEADGAVLAAAAALRAARKMGEGSGTDLLSIGLSATDRVGHSFGTGGTEMCLQLLSLDRDLGDFFARMDATGIDYMVMLSADHGGHDLPERNRQNAIPAERIDAKLNADDLGARIAAELKLPTPLLYATDPGGDYYIRRDLTAKQRADVIAAVQRVVRDHPQVEAMITADTLKTMTVPTRSPELWTLAERVRAGFDPERSGDFNLVIKDRVMPIARSGGSYVATHGSIWDYDRRVPMLFWRKGLAGFEQPNPVMTVDIAPTLAPFAGVTLAPSDVDGRCLDLVSGPATSCP